MGFDYHRPVIGSDPELFIRDGKCVIPAEEIFREDELPPGIRIDNAAVEFDINPGLCLEHFISNLGMRLRSLRRALNIRKMRSSRIHLVPSANLRSFDDFNYRSVREFGCSPSFVFHDNKILINTPHIDPLRTLTRSIGFHVHLGSFNEKPEILFTPDGHVRLVQMCDLFAGIPGVLMERKETESVLGRRQTLGYGKAGEFRRQKHGFEYRTLGPWPLRAPAWSWWAASAVRDAYHIVVNNLDSKFIPKFDMRKVAEVINTNDVVGAVQIWNKVGEIVLNEINGPNLFFDDSATSDWGIPSSAVLSIKLRRMFNFFVRQDLLPYGVDKFAMKSWNGRAGFIGHVLLPYSEYRPALNDKSYDQI